MTIPSPSPHYHALLHGPMPPHANMSADAKIALASPTAHGRFSFGACWEQAQQLILLIEINTKRNEQSK